MFTTTADGQTVDVYQAGDTTIVTDTETGQSAEGSTEEEALQKLGLSANETPEGVQASETTQAEQTRIQDEAKAADAQKTTPKATNPTDPQQPATSGSGRPDLYRNGNASQAVTASSPRVPQDITPDANGNVGPGQGGLSTWSTQQTGKYWWMLPGDVSLPGGLQATNDLGDHWVIEPAWSMSFNDYYNLIHSITEWVKMF